jgi:hypothetical protein
MERSEVAVINTSFQRGALGSKNSEPLQRFSCRVPKPLKRLNKSYCDLANPLKQGANESSFATQQRGG